MVLPLRRQAGIQLSASKAGIIISRYDGMIIGR
jgi:hypothetical protein